MALTLNNNLNTLKVGDYFWCYFKTMEQALPASYFHGDFGQVDMAHLFRWSIGDIASKTDYEVTGKELTKVWANKTSGYFRFIVVDVKPNGEVVLISDRNLSYNYTYQEYDNRYGLMQVGTTFKDLSERVRSENKCVGGTPIFSSCYTDNVASYGGQLAFDTNYTGTNWVPKVSSGDANHNKEWLGYQFTEPVCINSIAMVCNNYHFTYLGMKSLFLEYSDDGIAWTTVSSVDNEKYQFTNTGWTNIIDFNHNHTGKHLYWRLRMDSGTRVGYYVYICHLEMFEKVNTNISALDAFNTKLIPLTSNTRAGERVIELSDWDRYINSDLNGLIPNVGDNSVWNMNFPSLTSAFGMDNYVTVIRGGKNGDVNAFSTIANNSRGTANNVDTGIGLRLKLVLKRKDFIGSTAFFKQGGQFKTYSIGKDAEFKSSPWILPDFTNDGSTTTSTQNGITVTATTGTNIWKLLNRASDSWVSTDLQTFANITFDFGITMDKRVGGYEMSYKFGDATKLYTSAIYQDIYAAPRDWDVYGSTLGDKWVLVDSKRKVEWKQGETKKFSFDKAETYRFFKFVFISNNSDPKNIAINYLNLYDIQADKVNPFWKSLSTIMPSQNTIKNEGMLDLSVLDRKNRKLSEPLTLNSQFGSGNLYKGKLRLGTAKNIGSIKLL